MFLLGAAARLYSMLERRAAVSLDERAMIADQALKIAGAAALAGRIDEETAALPDKDVREKLNEEGDFR
jgi:hypothetical protein